MTLNNAIKTEAFDLVGLDSMNFEKEHYGWEYNHYLNLSYAVSELVRILAHSPEESTKKYADKAVFGVCPVGYAQDEGLPALP